MGISKFISKIFGQGGPPTHPSGDNPGLRYLVCELRENPNDAVTRSTIVYDSIGGRLCLNPQVGLDWLSCPRELTTFQLQGVLKGWIEKKRAKFVEITLREVGPDAGALQPQVDADPEVSAEPVREDSGIKKEAPAGPGDDSADHDEPLLLTISGLEEDLSCLEFQPSPSERPECKFESLFSTSGRVTGFRVFVLESVWLSVLQFCASDTSKELMGQLVGQVRRDAYGPYIEIEGHIPSRMSISTPVSGRDTEQGRIHSLVEKNARFPDAKYLGWYHTHPNLGVFLSATDIKTKQFVYPLWYQIAVVVDPMKGTFGFFRGQGQRISQFTSAFTFTTAAEGDTCPIGGDETR